MTNWGAPRAERAVDASVALPGSKSLTNRYLVLAALADEPSELIAPLRARDTLLMAAALTALGATIDTSGEDWAVVSGRVRPGSVDVGLAGTIMRFVPPVAGLADGPVAFDGDAYARNRPMRALLDGLRQAGMTVQDEGRGALPFTVLGCGAVAGGTVRVDAAASSQIVSGLLLSAARFRAGVEVVHTGERAVPSQPHLDMTLAVLRAAGVAAEGDGNSWRVEPGSVRGGRRVVEPDLSNAAPFLAAALVTGGTVRVPHWPAVTTQPGDALRGLLTALGASVSLAAGTLTVTGHGSVRAIDADLRDVTELVTVVAALAALADGPSQLRGLAHMRGHETDRLAALTAELTNLGCGVTEHADALTITPKPLHGGVWRAYADHRMATAGAVLGLAVDGVEIDDIASTTKTLPDFPGMWSAMLAG